MRKMKGTQVAENIVRVERFLVEIDDDEHCWSIEETFCTEEEAEKAAVEHCFDPNKYPNEPCMFFVIPCVRYYYIDTGEEVIFEYSPETGKMKPQTAVVVLSIEELSPRTAVIHLDNSLYDAVEIYKTADGAVQARKKICHYFDEEEPYHYENIDVDSLPIQLYQLIANPFVTEVRIADWGWYEIEVDHYLSDVYDLLEGVDCVLLDPEEGREEE